MYVRVDLRCTAPDKFDNSNYTNIGSGRKQTIATRLQSLHLCIVPSGPFVPL